MSLAQETKNAIRGAICSPSGAQEVIDNLNLLDGILDATELGYLDGVTAGTVTASKALVVDSNKDISSVRDIAVRNLDAGASGTAGTVDVFPSTASKGKLQLACTDQTGDTAVTVNANAMGQATTINLKDPGASSASLLTTTDTTAAATTATAAEITAHCDASARIVNVTASATALALTAATHANRLVILPIITGSGLTITLPAATGTGDKYTILNNGVQTLSLTVTALAGDIMSGLARGWHLTAGANDAFAPTAADIKYTFDCTTTGGDGGDIMELWDIATDKWFVNVDFFGSGTLATGFA